MPTQDKDTDGSSFTLRGTLRRIDSIPTKTGNDILVLIVDVDGQYPQVVPVKVFGRTCDDARNLETGARVEITGRLGGREWNGKIYPDIIALHVHQVEEPKQASLPTGAQPEATVPSEDSTPF